MCGEHAAALVLGLLVTGAALVYGLLRLFRCIAGWLDDEPVVIELPHSDSPSIGRYVAEHPNGAMQHLHAELDKRHCENVRAIAKLRGDIVPPECAVEALQSDIPDDLKADAELPLDIKAALVAVAWTLGLAEQEAKVESVQHRIRAARQTIERVIEAINERGVKG